MRSDHLLLDGSTQTKAYTVPANARFADDLLDLDEHDPATYRRLEAAVRD